MIGVKLMGGLGNQMFQYALGKKMALKHNTELFLDLSFYENQADIDTPRTFEIDCFNIKAKLIRKPAQMHPTLLSKLFNKPVFRIQYNEPHYNFDKEVLNQPDFSIFNGYWQSEKYFSDIRKELLNDFSLCKKMNNEDTDFKNSIKDINETVSLHVRRGDYVSNENANKHHGLKPVDYYIKAVKFMEKELGSFKLYVFSDDIEWCKKNLNHIHKSISFVEGDRPGYVDLELMRACKNNIIANSSFSWWAAWLNENPKKIVIAPSVWFNDPSKNTSDVVPKTWKRI